MKLDFFFFNPTEVTNLFSGQPSFQQLYYQNNMKIKIKLNLKNEKILLAKLNFTIKLQFTCQFTKTVEESEYLPIFFYLFSIRLSNQDILLKRYSLEKYYQIENFNR